MTKKQTAYLIALEERNKALAEEVQALEFEVKDKDKRIVEIEAELEVCENTHFIVHGENQLNIRRIKALEAELQQYKEPVAEFEVVGRYANKFCAASPKEFTESRCYVEHDEAVFDAGKTYRILVVEKGK